MAIVFHYYVPAKPLSDFVEFFWYWRGYEMAYAKERVLPMGNAGLVINLRSHRTSDSGISGARSQSIVIERRRQDELLAIHFKPGGALPFLGFPSGELHNRGITLADLWGERRAGELLCLLHESKMVETKFRVFERSLMQLAARPLKHHDAVSFAMKEFCSNPGLLSSAAMAAKVNLSQRRFIELFRDEVGLTPKLFCRVQRFQKVIKTVHQQDGVDWVDLALSFGYSDQSHFIHDFSEFSGVTPSKYLTVRTPHVNHIQIDG